MAKKLEVIVTSEDKKNFQENLDKAYTQIRKDTGYKGSFDEPKERKEFFDGFTIIPTMVEEKIRGVKIEYTLAGREEAEKSKKKGAGSSSYKTVYKV